MLTRIPVAVLWRPAIRTRPLHLASMYRESDSTRPVGPWNDTPSLGGTHMTTSDAPSAARGCHGYPHQAPPPPPADGTVRWKRHAMHEKKTGWLADYSLRKLLIYPIFRRRRIHSQHKQEYVPAKSSPKYSVIQYLKTHDINWHRGIEAVITSLKTPFCFHCNEILKLYT